MKLIKADADKFTFLIERRERQMLFRLLDLYPLVPLSHHQLSQSAEKSEDQQLLEEALNQQRMKNKEQVLAMLKSKSRFRETEHGYHFSLKNEQMEWLLQVINDVRVGSWLLMGSPKNPVETFAMLNQTTASYYWAMEVAAGFQMVFLAAMEQPGT
ncbi:MAG TPA: hypothetical protein VFB72_08105 [Verrucomicrobiae bacterium]|nr:hypothetical protein [Verrucomicrobiae bacterium]